MLMDIKDMKIETPEELERMDSEVSFLSDRQGRWSLALYRQRAVKADSGFTADYPTLITHLHHIIEGTVKEFYRYFRIKNKIVVGTHNIIDPMYIGFDSSLNGIIKDEMRTFIVDNIRNFEYISRGRYDEIPVVMNPILLGIHQRTQNWLNVDGIDLRAWMERFLIRKRVRTAFEAGGMYGENNVIWTRHAHPGRLPSFTAELPEYNFISVAYSSLFVIPECKLTDIDVTQLSQTMQSNANRAEPLTDVLIAHYNEKNYEDFRRILLAMCLPGQVMVDIEYARTANSILLGFSALVAKLLFSTSPGFQNISDESARETDMIIGDMLKTFGYFQDVQAAPLNVESRRYAESALWAELATRPQNGKLINFLKNKENVSKILVN